MWFHLSAQAKAEATKIYKEAGSKPSRSILKAAVEVGPRDAAKTGPLPQTPEDAMAMLTETHTAKPRHFQGSLLVFRLVHWQD